jgi:hypothetical protein
MPSAHVNNSSWEKFLIELILGQLLKKLAAFGVNQTFVSRNDQQNAS